MKHSRTSSRLLIASLVIVTVSSFALKAKRNLVKQNYAHTPRNMNMHHSCSLPTQLEFQGKTVLLTGASGGLGKAFALHLAECNVSTLILSARKKENLEQVAQECQSLCPTLQTHCIECDLGNADSVNRLASQALQVSSSNKIDVLINNGGVSSRSRFIDTTIDVDRQVMQINFLSGAALAKAVVPGMIQRNYGRIIWVSSVQGLVGIPNRSSYAASKFAVQGYCESIRAELLSSNVVVTVASPGYIRTNLSNSAITGDGTKYGKMDATTAAGADPNDVAREILEAATKKQAEIVVAAGLSAKLAIYLRLLCPGLLRYSLVKRYEKSVKLKED